MQTSTGSEKSTRSPDQRQAGQGSGEGAGEGAGEGMAVSHWWVYMIRCDDGSLYTGVSTEPERRFQEHLQHPRGAKYFNGRQPVAIVYTEPGHTRSSACREEARIKKLDRAQKLQLIMKRL